MIDVKIAFIRKFVQNTAQVSDKNKTALKVVFLPDFFIVYKFQSLICYICKEKMKVFAGVLGPQITKRLGPQIANPRSFTFAKGPKSNK
jgi:hypothetical protein